MADRMRFARQGSRLSASTVALEYITTTTGKHSEKKTVVAGSAITRTDRTLTMDGWQNVIVYEVRDGSPDGTLIQRIGRHAKTHRPRRASTPTAWQPSWKVYAVQYDNKRIEVTF